MDKGWIPRNLIEQDVIKLGAGISFSLSDLPFIGSGGVLAYTVSTYIPNLIVKVSVAAVILAAFYLITKIKYQGQKTPELCINSSMYVGRQAHYSIRRRQLKPREKKSIFQKLSLKGFSLKNLSLKAN